MITSVFLLLVLVAGVQSAIIELGEACNTATPDSCVSPLAVLVCDTPPTKTTGVCRVKAGQPCKNAGGLCVVGAECTTATDTCDCKAGYTLNPTSGQCTPPNGGYYDTCDTSTTDCTLTGVDSAASACTTDGGCKCATATPVPTYADGHCVALDNLMVGQACTTGGGGDFATTCGTTSHLTCVTNACECDAGYFPTKTPGGTCVVNADSTVGIACTVGSTPSACTGQNEECDAGTTKCACKSGFTSVPGGVCFPDKGTLKGGCNTDADCGGGTGFQCTSVPKTCKTELAADGNCSDTTATACATGLTCTAGKCAKTVVSAGGSCADTATTVCAMGLVCDTTCKTEIDVGGDCTDTTSKQCKARTTCTSNKCEVGDTFIGGSCTVATAFDQGNCAGSGLCGAATNGICVCPSGSQADPAEDCAIIAHMYGAVCTATTAATKGDCGDDSLICSGTTGTCGCATATGYTGGSDGGVCYKYSANSLGGACTTSSCTDPNAECSGSVCQCKTGFTKSFFTGQCVVKADATTVCTELTCIEGSQCDATTHFCTCVTGTAPLGDGLCAPTAVGVLGGPCTITATDKTAKGTCTVANTRCQYGRCACEDPYTATLEGSCRSSDAMMMTTSSLLITLAAVISQLFVR